MIKSREIDDILLGIRGFLPFYVVNNQPKNRLERLLSYSTADVIPASLPLINKDGTTKFSKVGIGIAPTYDLDVVGDINFTGSLYQDGIAAVFSNWSTNGSDIYRDSNVGIGDFSGSAPAYSLDVSGDGNFTGSSTGITYPLTLTNSDVSIQASGVGIEARVAAANSTFYSFPMMAFVKNGTWNGTLAYNDGHLRLYALNDGNSVEVIRIMNTGRVGINHTNPQKTLDVVGDINFTGSLYQNGIAAVFSNWSTNAGTIYRNSNIGIGDFSGSAPAHALDVIGDINLTGSLKVNGTDAVFSNWIVDGSNIYRDSNVGIGTTFSPSNTIDTKLVISGDYDGAAAFGGPNPDKGLTIEKTSGSMSDWSIGDSFGISFTVVDFGITTLPVAGIYAVTKGIGSYADGELHLLTKENTDSLLQSRMVIDKTGNVGIGTTTPSYALDVVGSLHSTGAATFADTTTFPMRSGKSLIIEVDSGSYWSLGWWQASDGSWWLLGKTGVNNTFNRADAEFYIPTGNIADVPAS